MLFKEKVVKIISLFLCRYKNVQDFFVARSEDIDLDGFDSKNRTFYDIDNEDDFYAICKKFNFTVPDADIAKRFSEKSHFCLITEEKHYGCWGWYNNVLDSFYVLEIDRISKLPENSAILFHYYSNPEYRRKGFYFDLLRNVALKNGKPYSIIYAYDTNPASSNAIKKAGFKFAGRLSHKSFSSLEALIDSTED